MSANSVLSETHPGGAGPLVASQPVTFPRVVKSESVKFRSLRSSWAVLGGAVFGIPRVSSATGTA